MDTDAYIRNTLLASIRYLVVAVSEEGTISDLKCPGSEWSIQGLSVGGPLPENLQAVLNSTPKHQRSQLYPLLYMDETCVVDVHVLREGSDQVLILQDVSKNHRYELELQQKAYEISLLLEKQTALNQELELRRAEAESASRAKSRFIASMSHEFRSPITSIMGHVDLLADKDSGSAAAIQRASWHLLTLVENLLEQARQGEGIVQLHHAPVALESVMEDMQALFSIQAKSRGLLLNISGPTGAVSLVSDELRLRQVLINLLSNAIRFTREGSIELAVSRLEDSVKFSVKDTGPGISLDDQSTIFQPFKRLESDGTHGAGLGLTITRQLVKAMGGELMLDSEPGRGSIFYFRLPLSAAEEPDVQADFHGLNALLVDDDADILVLLESHLNDWGMNVHSASCCASAMKLADNQQFDLILTDYNLQDGNGLELMKSIRPKNGKCKMILCSGTSMVDSPDLLASELPDEILQKPVKPELLKSVVGRVLGAEC